MKPVLEPKKKNYKLWIIYTIIILIAISGIAVVIYFISFQNEELGLGDEVSVEQEEKDEEYNNLKLEFESIFDNQLNIINTPSIEIEKLKDNYDLVCTPFSFQKEEENISINANIPYINIKNNNAIELNRQITNNYKMKAEELMNQVSSMNYIYTVEYKAYIQNDILSLAIRSQYKEGNKNQKTLVDTFNYNLRENRTITIDELLSMKKIEKQYASNKIKDEIKKIQEQNMPLIEQGYTLYKRDYTSNIYDISKTTNFLYGKDGLLYIIYSYGKNEDTNEMDIVIF